MKKAGMTYLIINNDIDHSTDIEFTLLVIVIDKVHFIDCTIRTEGGISMENNRDAVLTIVIGVNCLPRFRLSLEQ